MGRADTSRRSRHAPQFDPELGLSFSMVYCVDCGRFLGSQAIAVGAVRFFCSNCKHFTVIMGESGLFLTEVENNGKMNP